nr:cytochrome P450 3049B1-1 [Brachionus rubens]
MKIFFTKKMKDFFSNIRVSRLLALLAGVGLTTFGYKTLQIYLLRRKYRHIPGPKTQGILGFYLGNAIDIAASANKKTFPDVISDWSKQFGYVFKFQLADRMVVFTLDPETLKRVFITENFSKHSDVYRSFGFPLGARFIGNGLITELENSKWRHRRDMFNPSFHKQALVGFMEEFNTKSDLLMEKLRTMADGKQVITLLDEFNNMTLDVIATVGFGMQIDSIQKDNDLKKYVFESFRGFARSLIDPSIWFTLDGRKYIIQYRKILKELRSLGRNQVLTRIKTFQDGGYSIDDLLSIMLKNNQGEKFELEDLVDDFTTFFVAGQETTANLLGAAVLEIGQKPEVMKKIKDEIDLEIGSKTDLKYEDLTKLKYLSSVIKETLRKWSIIPAMSRRNDVPIKICGYEIPVGTNIQVSSYVSGNYEEFFPNANEFDPERFYSNKYEIKNYTYFPFGLGARNCIGQNFAQIESKVCLVKFFQNFDIQLDPGQSFRPIQHSTISPESRTRCTLTVRN